MIDMVYFYILLCLFSLYVFITNRRIKKIREEIEEIKNRLPIKITEIKFKEKLNSKPLNKETSLKIEDIEKQINAL